MWWRAKLLEADWGWWQVGGKKEGGKIRNSFLGHWGEGDSAGGRQRGKQRSYPKRVRSVLGVREGFGVDKQVAGPGKGVQS